MYPSPNYKQVGNIEKIRSVPFPEKELKGIGWKGRSSLNEHEKTKHAQTNLSERELALKISDITSHLCKIPVDERLSEPDWRKIGAAIHYETGGCEAGYNLFHQWSCGLFSGGLTHPNYSEEEVKRKWSGYNGVDVPAKIGSIVQISKDFMPSLFTNEAN